MRPLTRFGFVIGLLALSSAPHAQQAPSAVTLPGLEQAIDKITVTEPAPPPAPPVQQPAQVVTPTERRTSSRQGARGADAGVFTRAPCATGGAEHRAGRRQDHGR